MRNKSNCLCFQNSNDALLLKLAQLHSKQASTLVMGNFQDSIQSWIQKLTPEDTLFIDSNLNLHVECLAQTVQYSNHLGKFDLQQCLQCNVSF